MTKLDYTVGNVTVITYTEALELSRETGQPIVVNYHENIYNGGRDAEFK